MLQPVDMTMYKVDISIIFYFFYFLICLFLVLDTDNTELLKKCGTGLPDKLVSKGNTLTVNFKTDYSVGAKVLKRFMLIEFL